MENNKIKDKNLTELKEIAKAIGLTGVSKCNKGELIDLITGATIGGELEDNQATENETLPTKPNVQEKKVYELTDIIPVISLVKNGGLTFIDYEKTEQRWEKYGDEIDLTYKDLRLMKSKYKRFFRDCWVKIPDDAADQLRLEDYLTNSKIRPETIDNAFLMKPDDFYDALIGSTDGIQKLVVDAAVEKLRNKELDSLRIMRIIKQVTKQDVEELARFIDFNEEASGVK
jgi:hypothetical protein